MTTHIYYPYFTITPKMTQCLEAIGVALGYLQAMHIPANYRRELVSKITAEIVHTSTAIEGNTLTAQQVFDILHGKKVQAQEIDIKEVINYSQALAYVEELAQNPTLEITEQMILNINAILLHGIRDDIAGRYRVKQVIVGDYLPPEHYRVPPLMSQFVTWLNNPQPPALASLLYTGVAHYQLVGIHPFEDGNGRTARILTTLLLLRNGYRVTSLFALESYYNRARRAYYAALASADQYRVDGKPDLTRWLEYYLEGILIEAERARSRITSLQPGATTESHLVLSDAQLRMLQHVYESGRAYAADLIRISALSRKGAYNMAQSLVEKGLLQRRGQKKGSHYVITELGVNTLRFSTDAPSSYL